MKQLLTIATVSLLVALASCGGKATPAAATTPPVTEAPAAPTLGPDECCCPFASAEGVAFNVSPRVDCEAAGSQCVDAASCLAPS